MIFEVKGVQINYISKGKYTDPVLLYIHGNLGSLRWFKKVMDISGYRTVAMDMPNFGDSDSLDNMEIDTYADYVVLFLQKFLKESGNKNAVVAGHSLGGAVAVSLAVRYSGFVSRLILIDPPPLNGLVTPPEHYPYIEKYKSDKKLLKEALRSVTPTMNDEPFLNKLTEDAFKMNKKAFIGHVKSLENFNYESKVSIFTGSVLVIVGGKDILITGEMGNGIARSFIKVEYKFIEEVGHSVIVEAPEVFKNIIEVYLHACT